MRLVLCPTKCNRKLAHNEAKRIPVQDHSYLAGYYIGCPGCGRPQSLSATAVRFSEKKDNTGIVLTMSPVTCANCDILFRVDAGEVICGA